ncbi:glycosyltransferase family 2 protein [Halopolyspora algeriensis]|uniref:glycosyltransferase family 2 protein n=1 Tax=Halopolyspora algeriensis TaxID=1500506 RepID=UPI003B82C891
MREPVATRTTIVIATRNRVTELMTTLRHHRQRSPESPVIVVDNASTDGTAAAVRHRFPEVRLLRARRNMGATARNLGVLCARTPYIAFSDDDSWWAAGSLGRAEAILDDHPRLALIAARPLVGPENRPDPITELMAHSPLRSDRPLPGPAVLGFMACAAVVRREAFLGVGGFHPLLFFVAEERLLSYDLAAAGWSLAYVDTVITHHHPSGQRPGSRQRHSVERRNLALIAWMRRPWREAFAETRALLRESPRSSTALRALGGTLRRLPRALARRRALPAEVERQIATLRTAPDNDTAG